MMSVFQIGRTLEPTPRVVSLYLLALFLGGRIALASCEIEPGHYDLKKFELSGKAMDVRDTYVLDLCNQSGVMQIDSTDPTLKGRLVHETGLSVPHSLLVRLATYKVTKPAVFIYILYSKGTVHLPKLLESSGNAKFDAIALEGMSQVRYTTPARLDGMPTPVLGYSVYDERRF